MKFKAILPIILLTIALALPLITDARSGCCSHHGGVCGCGCCDGTPLSTTCAPYYPWCNESNSNSDYNPPAKSNPSSGFTGYNSETNTNKEDDSSFWWGLGIVGLGGAGAYYYIKNKK